MRVWVTAVLMGFVAGVGCRPRDVPRPRYDAGAREASAGDARRPSDAGTRPGDLTPDAPRPPAGDAGPLPARTITFVAGDHTGQALYTLDTATGRAVRSTAFSSDVTFDIRTELSRNAQYQVGQPRHLMWGTVFRDGYRLARIPGGRGFLRVVMEPSARRSSLYLQRPDGTLRLLYRNTSPPGGPIMSHVWVVNRAGTRALGAIPYGPTALIVRLDGSRYPGGKAAREVSIPGLPADVRIYASALTRRNAWVVTANAPPSTSAQKRALYRIPLDGRSGASPVKLPRVGTLIVDWVEESIVVSEDESHILITAGKATSRWEDSIAEDVIVVDESGRATNLTRRPGRYDDFGKAYVRGGGNLAISPSGKWAAFVRLTTDRFPKHALEVRSAAGAGPRLTLVDPARLPSPTITGMLFPDDHSLLFTTVSGGASIYRYDLTASKFTTVLGGGSLAGPRPSGGGTASGMEYVWSPNRRYLYIVVTGGGSGGLGAGLQRPVYVVDTKAAPSAGRWKPRDLLPGHKVWVKLASPGAFCTRKSLAVLSFLDAAGRYGIWMFDMDRATRPARLMAAPTADAKPLQIRVSGDCSHALVLFDEGKRPGNLYLISLAPRPRVTNLTGAIPNARVSPEFALSPDGKLGAFVAGESIRDLRLRAVDVARRKVVALFPRPAGSIAWRSWQILGIR